MQWITDNIAIGSRSDLKHIDLDEFDAVLSLDSTTRNNIPKYWNGHYKSVYIPDSGNVEAETIREALEFLDRFDDGGQIFVHCKMGRSRSVSIVATHLWKEAKLLLMNHSDSLDYIEKRVRKSKITKSFKKKLLEFSSKGLL